jgi:hypothetical protein
MVSVWYCGHRTFGHNIYNYIYSIRWVVVAFVNRVGVVGGGVPMLIKCYHTIPENIMLTISAGIILYCIQHTCIIKICTVIRRTRKLYCAPLTDRCEPRRVHRVHVRIIRICVRAVCLCTVFYAKRAMTRWCGPNAYSECPCWLRASRANPVMMCTLIIIRVRDRCPCIIWPPIVRNL